MRVSHLALDDFRSWKHGVVELPEGPTVLVGANTTVRTMPRISRGLTCARLMRARLALPRTISSSMTCSRPEATTRARMTAPPGAASASSMGMRTSAPSAPTLCDEKVDR